MRRLALPSSDMVTPSIFELIRPESIARCEALIRPHFRRTPVIEIEAADGGVASRPLPLKEAASFMKPRARRVARQRH
jgi:hypothetical protein